MESKSGRLHKFSNSIFGYKWRKKWVHLHENYLKYYPVSEQQAPSLISLKPKRCMDLRSCTIEQTDEAFKEKYGKKFSFQVTTKQKNRTIKLILACNNEIEYRTWLNAIQSRSSAVFQFRPSKTGSASEVFDRVDVAKSGSIPSAKLRELLHLVEWKGSSTEFNQIQQYLDPDMLGCISKNRFLKWRQCVATGDSIFAETPEERESSFSNQCEHDSNGSYGSENWNDSYQKLFTTVLPSDDTVTKSLKMAQFSGRFKDLVETTVRTIVEEYSFPNELKSIKPVNGKIVDLSLPIPSSLNVDVHYSHQGLHFHLFNTCRDVDSDLSGLSLRHSKTSVVQKILGHEIRAMKAFSAALERQRAHASAQDKISVYGLLESVVDYLGFRFFVSAVPLVNLADSGQQINRNPQIHKQLQQIAKELNVLPEIGVDSGSAASNLCHDARIFRSTDRRVYISRLSNLMPPDLPSPNTNEIVLLKLRPECVAEYATPLCPNAYRAIPTADPSIPEQASQVVASASQELRLDTVSAFREHLELLEILPLGSGSFTEYLHNRGINVRHVGLICQETRMTHIRKTILCEMVARACKTIFRDLLRLAVESTNVIKKDDAPKISAAGIQQFKAKLNFEIKKSFVDFCNLVLGNGPNSSKLYKDKLLPEIASKFNGFELPLSSALELHRPQLFWALQHHLRIQFAERSNYQFNIASPLKLDDLLHFEISSKIPTKVFGSTDVILKNIDTYLDDQEYDLAILGLELALSIEEACPSSQSALPMARLLLRMAQVSLDTDELDKAEEFSTAAFERVPKTHAFSAKCRLTQMRIKHMTTATGDHDLTFSSYIEQELQEAVRVVEWHMGYGHPLIYEIYIGMVDIMQERNAIGSATKYLAEAVDCLSKSVGGSNVLIACPRRRQGELLKLANKPLDAISMYEDALRIHESQASNVKNTEETRRHNIHAATCCHEITLLLMQTNENNKAFKYALKALSLRESALESGHTDIVHSMIQIASLSEELNEDIRALQYYRQALAILKLTDVPTMDVTVQILLLYLKTLSPERQLLLDDHRQVHHPDFLLSGTVMPLVKQRLENKDPVTYMNEIFDELLESDGIMTAQENSLEPNAADQLLGVLQLLPNSEDEV